jgi:hypothetical protein
MTGTHLYGQSTAFTATLSGNVDDATGAVLSGAKVTLTDTERAVSQTYTTQTNGFYSFTFLPPGVYTLAVEAPGFKEYEQEGITLEAGQNVDQNISLAVGTVSEKVEVTAQAPLLNAENANISMDLSAATTEDLPLNFRSVISLTELNSSVSNTAEEQVVGAPGLSQTADQDISFLNFGGTFFDTAEYLLDGTWDTRTDWGGVIYVPSVDDIAELRIQTNSFTAQYGFSSGNVVNMVTKAGSNGFHGDAYEFYSSSALDAIQLFQTTKPPVSRNQYGGTFGGPIKKNKAYFFVNYEGLKQAQSGEVNEVVPTSAEEGGNFAAELGAQIGTDALGRPIYSGEIYNPFSTRQVTCGAVDPVTGDAVSHCTAAGGLTTEEIRDPFGGNISTGIGVTNIIPANLMDAIAKKIAAGGYYPSPTNPNAAAQQNNFTATAPGPETSNEYSGRVDYDFNDNNRVNARWSQKFQTKANTPEFFGASDQGGPGLVNPNNRYSTDVGYDHIFNSSFAMNVNVGVNRHVEEALSQGFGFQSSSLGLPTFVNSIAPAFPEIAFNETYAGLGASGGNNNYQVPQTQWTETVDFTKVKGKHEFEFGFSNFWLRLDGGHEGITALDYSNAPTQGPNPENNLTNGDSFASFLLGVGMQGSANGNGGTFTQFAAFPATDKNFLGWYLQDTLKATSRLTFNLGIRYEIQTAPTERHNAQQYFNFTAENPISGLIGSGANYPGELVFSSPSNRGLYDQQYKDVAPRIGVAYQMHNSVVLRAGYGIFYVPEFYGQGPNDGYSQTTASDSSNNDNLNPASTLSGITVGGVVYPSAFPTGELVPTGNSLGSLTGLGQGIGVVNNVKATPFVQQWMAGLEFSLSNNDLVNISYVGNNGSHVLATGLNWDVMPAADLSLGIAALNAPVANPFFGQAAMAGSSCGLNNPTVPKYQLLEPFPEYCSVSEGGATVGSSNYNALEATFSHRWHSGLDLNVSYTYSKFLDNVQGASGWALPGGGNNIENPYNLGAEKSVDATNIPNSLVVSYVYQLPFGRGKAFGSNWNHGVDAVLGGWGWSGVLTAKSGLPLSVSGTDNLSGFGFGNRPNLVPGASLVPSNQGPGDWINAAAFSEPTGVSFGDAPRFLNGILGPSLFDWDMSVQKRWNFTEGKIFEFRFEMFNALNHGSFFLPNTNLTSGSFGEITAGYQMRIMQFAGKFYF